MPDPENKYTVFPTIEDKDVYRAVLDTRNFEISYFWQRSNYFLVLNSALAVGFFNIKKSIYGVLLAIFGFTVSWLWFQVNLGSKFWQSRWEQRLSNIETKIAPGINLYSADEQTILDDVKKSIENSNHRTAIQQWIDNQILKRPSVSYNMTLLSLLFLIGWIILFLLAICGNAPSQP